MKNIKNMIRARIAGRLNKAEAMHRRIYSSSALLLIIGFEGAQGGTP